MSIEIVLVPLAVAAVSAWQAKRSADQAGRQIVAVGTRMRDQGLLTAALNDTGARVNVGSGDSVTAEWAHSRGTFARNDDGIWSVHFEGDTTLDDATDLVARVDAAYGLRVQAEVLARLRERAPEAGMDVESETVEDDQSVTLVLNVNGGAS